MAPKNKPNAFLFFMIEWKKQQEARGRKFPNGIKDVQQDPQCNDAWKELSPEEKALYKQIEKSERTNPSFGPGSKGKKEKLTGLGEPVSAIDKAELQKQAFEDRMKEWIKTTINTAKLEGNLQDLKFYVIHVNYFYCRVLDNNKADYHPCEMSLIEFSLREGITKIYTELLREKIYLGFRSDAQTMSANSHNIPIDLPDAEDNYENVYRKIVDFLEPSQKHGRYPPLFTCEGTIAPVKSMLQRACEAFDRKDDFFLVYSFEYLFTCIFGAICEELSNIPYQDMIAKIELQKDPFAYKPGLECDFHMTVNAGCLYCSESVIKRWVYTLFNHCCEPLGIDLLEVRHKPMNVGHGLRSNISTLNASFSTINLGDTTKKTGQTLSMTGVSEKHRVSVSERSYLDEIRRRAAGKPVQVIDHSKLSAVQTPVVAALKNDDPIERPLRLPKTKSSAPIFLELEKASQASEDQSTIDLSSEASFPPISSERSGRASSILKKKIGGYAGAVRK